MHLRNRRRRGREDEKSDCQQQGADVVHEDGVHGSDIAGSSVSSGVPLHKQMHGSQHYVKGKRRQGDQKELAVEVQAAENAAEAEEERQVKVEDLQPGDKLAVQVRHGNACGR